MKLTLFEVWKYKAMFLLEYKLSVTIKWQTYIQEDSGYFGFDLRARTDKKILVLKSRGHFRAAYEPFSKFNTGSRCPRINHAKPGMVHIS